MKNFYIESIYERTNMKKFLKHRIYTKKITSDYQHFQILKKLIHYNERQHNEILENLNLFFKKKILEEDYSIFLKDLNDFIKPKSNSYFLKNSIFIESFLFYK